MALTSQFLRQKVPTILNRNLVSGEENNRSQRSHVSVADANRQEHHSMREQ